MEIHKKKKQNEALVEFIKSQNINPEETNLREFIEMLYNNKVINLFI